MRYVLVLLVSLLPLSLWAQDIIIKKDGQEIPAKVREILPDQIRYHRFDYLDGPIIALPRSEVFMIKFQNGTKELMGAVPPQPVQPVQPALPPGVVKQEVSEQVVEQVHLSGPRIGATMIGNGELSEQLRDDYDASSLITQFGWQFETRFFTLPSGTSGLFEFVPLVGGLEQGLFLPSVSGLVGLRGKSGLEFGVGPNVSLAGAAFVLAAGVNMRTKEVNFPINVSVVPSGKGTRYSLLMGFNIRSR